MRAPIENILKQFENQTQLDNSYTHNEQLNHVPTGNSTSDTQQENAQQNTRNNHNQGQITVKNGQENSVKNMPPHSKIKEPNEKGMLTSN